MRSGRGYARFSVRIDTDVRTPYTEKKKKTNLVFVRASTSYSHIVSRSISIAIVCRSRLGCQVIVEPKHEGVRVRVDMVSSFLVAFEARPFSDMCIYSHDHTHLSLLHRIRFSCCRSNYLRRRETFTSTDMFHNRTEFFFFYQES